MNKLITKLGISLLICSNVLLAQDKTIVTANSSDISDNLDLRAVATLFGDSRNLEEFEQKLNDPKSQITNLDLNNDNYVDYLRVIETVEKHSHIIVVQAVLGKDMFQDVASIEVEKDNNKKVYVQVVGDPYLYGANYIYEPVYVHVPVIYDVFWTPYYRPYCSSWYWNYYPSYYACWNPWPVFRYRNHIHVHINLGISFHYSSFRRCHDVYNTYYYGRRGNYCERSNPNYAFNRRHKGYNNRHELDNHRVIKTRNQNSNELTTVNPRGNSNIGTPRNEVSPRPKSNELGNPRNLDNNEPRPRDNNGSPRNFEQPKPRNQEIVYPRNVDNIEPRPRNNNGSPRNFDQPRPRNEVVNTPRPKENYSTSPRNFEQPKPRISNNNDVPRNSNPRMDNIRNNNSNFSTPRSQGGMTMRDNTRGGRR